MQAAFITGYGGREVMAFGALADPIPAEGQALVEVHAAGVNPVELSMREGRFGKVLPYTFPQVTGMDISGVVLSAPAGSGFQPGDEVYARMPNNAQGAYAELAVVPAALLARKPARLSHVEAASLPTVALTTWQSFFERAHLKKGRRLLVQAGAGGIGTFAIQLARHLGVHVTATAGPSNQEFLRELGVDRAIDYTREKFEDAGPYDVIYDGVCGDLVERGITSLAPGGRYIGLVQVADVQAYMSLGHPEPIARLAASAALKYDELARSRGGEFHGPLTRPDAAQLDEIGQIVDQGVIKAFVSQVFPLDRLPQAYEAMGSGRTRGKLVVDVRGRS
jgi:NADPH:quinone reductase-like Zn-dependent oxidoreductase